MGLAIILFAVTFLTVVACAGLGFAFFKSKQKRQIRSMLHKAEETPVSHTTSELIRPAEAESTVSRLLSRFSFMDRLELMLEQSGKGWSSSKLVMMSAGAGAIGTVLGSRITAVLYPAVNAPICGVLAALIPFGIVMRMRKKNISAFEEQFPEALDFLSRSMRAGHGFSVGLEMLGTDSPDPLGSAFRRVSNDVQLGASTEEALSKLMLQVPLVDVRFFVSSVLLQQETGGNLGEILNKLSYVIRERFRLKGQVKAASAHGRITGLVLLLMPVGVTIFIMMTNPHYLTEMMHDHIGRYLIWGAVLGQVVGYFVIKKIVNIKV